MIDRYKTSRLAMCDSKKVLSRQAPIALLVDSMAEGLVPPRLGSFNVP